MKSNASQTFVNKLTLNNVTLFDSWLSDQYDHAQETFFDLKQSVSYISNHNVNTGNYLLVSSIYLDETEATYKSNVLTISLLCALPYWRTHEFHNLNAQPLAWVPRTSNVLDLYLSKIFIFSEEKREQELKRENDSDLSGPPPPRNILQSTSSPK